MTDQQDSRRLPDVAEIPSAPDAELLMRFVKQREEAAFELLVQRHAVLVMGICRQVLRDGHDAEDAFQATFLILAKRAHTIRRQSSVAAWLHQVAFRTAVRAAKERIRRNETKLDSDPVMIDDSFRTIEQQELQRAFHEELGQLPDRYQLPLVLCCLQGMTRGQAAEQLECTEVAVKARLARGRKLLRMRLARRGVALSFALAAVTSSMAKAASVVSSDLIAVTVKSGAALTAGSTHATTDAGISKNALTIANEGVRTMLYSSVIRPGLAAVLLGAVTLGTITALREPQTASANHGGEGVLTLAAAERDDTGTSADAQPSAVVRVPVESAEAAGGGEPLDAGAASPVATSDSNKAAVRNPGTGLQVPSSSDTNAVLPRHQAPATPANRWAPRLDKIERDYLLEKAAAFDKRVESKQLVLKAARAEASVGQISQSEILLAQARALEAEADIVLYQAEAARLRQQAEAMKSTTDSVSTGFVPVPGDPRRAQRRFRPVKEIVERPDGQRDQVTRWVEETVVAEEVGPMTSQPLPSAEPKPDSGEGYTELRIRPGTLLEISATGIGDSGIAGRRRVEPSGRIAVGPGVGRVDVTGKSLEQAEKAINDQLRRHGVDCAVMLTLAASESLDSFDVSSNDSEATIDDTVGITPNSIIQIVVTGVDPKLPIAGAYRVETSGRVPVGPGYGRVLVAGMTYEEAEDAIRKHLMQKGYADPQASVSMLRQAGTGPAQNNASANGMIQPGSLIVVQSFTGSQDPEIDGVFKVEPAGTVPLGPEFGRLKVAGMTVEAAEAAIRAKLLETYTDAQVMVAFADALPERSPPSDNASALDYAQLLQLLLETQGQRGATGSRSLRPGNQPRE